ncbi:hypothetical protein ACMA5I_15615 [Paracoccaceae bacterium GXU_MW_L88]
MNPHEFLRLNAACAASPTRFCISLDEGDPDDPFSIILSYDGRFDQPWSRTNAPRKIVAIEVLKESSGTVSYAAISDEGDIYVIDDTEVRYEKIAGAGLYSEDSVGYGPISGAAGEGNHMWVFGFGGQFYRLNSGGWQKIDIEDEAVARFSIVGGQVDASGSGWFCGSVTPPLLVEDYKPDPTLNAQIDAAAAAGDLEKVMKLMDQLGNQMSGGSDGATEPLLLRNEAGSVNRVSIDEESVQLLTDIYVESPNRVWLIGSEGAVLFGNLESGFRMVPYAEQINDVLISMDRFNDQYILASDFGLYTFDGHKMDRLKPKLPSSSVNQNTPNPLSIKSVGEVLMYFDQKHGVCRWDGETWDWIDIPDALLERDFKGLP